MIDSDFDAVPLADFYDYIHDTVDWKRRLYHSVKA